MPVFFHKNDHRYLIYGCSVGDKCPFFRGLFPGNNDPHIRILAGFPGADGLKICARKQLGLKGFGGHQAR